MGVYDLNYAQAFYIDSSVSWDIEPYIPWQVILSLGGTFAVHLQGQQVSKTRNQRETGSKRRSQLIRISDFIGSGEEMQRGK
jgi:hypothetical protein